MQKKTLARDQLYFSRSFAFKTSYFEVEEAEIRKFLFSSAPSRSLASQISSLPCKYRLRRFDNDDKAKELKKDLS